MEGSTTYYHFADSEYYILKSYLILFYNQQVLFVWIHEAPEGCLLRTPNVGSRAGRAREARSSKSNLN